MIYHNVTLQDQKPTLLPTSFHQITPIHIYVLTFTDLRRIFLCQKSFFHSPIEIPQRRGYPVVANPFAHCSHFNGQLISSMPLAVQCQGGY